MRRRALLAGIGAAGLGAILPTMADATAIPDPFVADLQARTFRWFLDTTDATTGLAPDRHPTKAFASIAATGFALTAWPIGAKRGWITRDEAGERTLTTLRFLERLPQGPEARGRAGHKGFFYHFLEPATGHRFGDSELSSVDTALLMAGVLFAAGWFDHQDADEAEIRRLARLLYERVDWAWAQTRGPAIAHGWSPEAGFLPYDWRGYSEAMLLYLLALGSPTHPVAPAAWSAWAGGYDRAWGKSYGQRYLGFGPLFGHQYSHVWTDFRGLADGYMRGRGIDYFENSRRATQAQRAYAIRNPMEWAGYGADVWGLTACDGPGAFRREVRGVIREFRGYSARGPGEFDDGTLAPTAAASAIAFAPEIVVPALKTLRQRWGDAILDDHGFIDAFNPTLVGASAEGLTSTTGRFDPVVGWVARDRLGIDQGPILAMIENHHSGLVWSVMRRDPNLVRGLRRAGFTGGWLGTAFAGS